MSQNAPCPCQRLRPAGALGLLRAQETAHATHVYTHHTPGRDQPVHWGYYSCNGFTPDAPPAEVEGKWRGITPLWRDVMQRHAAAPMHVMVRRLCVNCV